MSSESNNYHSYISSNKDFISNSNVHSSKDFTNNFNFEKSTNFHNPNFVHSNILPNEQPIQMNNQFSSDFQSQNQIKYNNNINNESYSNNNYNNNNYQGINYNASNQQPYQSMLTPQHEQQMNNQNGFYNTQTYQEPSKGNDSIFNRSANNAELNNLEFDGNIRQYYLNYIDSNSSLMPIQYRRKINFINKLNLFIPVGCVFHMIMCCVNYIPENIALAKKNFLFSGLLLTGTVYYSRIFIKQYQIQSYNELLSTYSESQIKDMVDKTILINRNL